MNRIPLFLAGAAAAAVLAIHPAPCPAAEPTPEPAWTWPARARNLKILPERTTPESLRATMTGFTRALGVRCSHCHVGEEGRPLATYDFASDRNPRKRTARGMMKLVKEVNEELSEMRREEDETHAHAARAHANDDQVECVTCHRGLQVPRTLSSTLTRAYDAGGADSAIAQYMALRRGYHDAGGYDFREPSLDALGEFAYGKSDTNGALKIFELNMRQFPESGGVYARLAQLYLARGDTARAVTNFQRALNVDPKNGAALDGMRRLRRR